MSVIIEDRPIESVREEVIDQLIMNYSHGKLSHDAFERRLDKAMESKCNKEVFALAEDLELVVDKNYVNEKKKDFSVNYSGDTAQELDYIINVFSGSNRSGRWHVAKKIRAFSIFSGADIDFTDAIFTQPVITIRYFSLFSGDNIYVPEDVNVVLKSFCIFGSVNNNAPCNASHDAPTIIIEGFSIFSGVTIEVRRSLKEKVVAFADSLKKMFS
jgi:hypothetical protein